MKLLNNFFYIKMQHYYPTSRSPVSRSQEHDASRESQVNSKVTDASCCVSYPLYVEHWLKYFKYL